MNLKKMTEFIAFNPYIHQLRTDKGWRITFDLSEDQYDKIKDLPKLQDILLKVSIVEEK